MDDKRPTFYTKGANSPIRAGGVIIYKRVNQHYEFLLIKKQVGNIAIYEDIGGKTDKMDKTVLDTVSRETCEETNSIIGVQRIKDQLKVSKSIYITKSKYMLYFVKANKYEKNLKPLDFGDIEVHSSIHRTFEWVDTRLITDNTITLHQRLVLISPEYRKTLISLL